MTVPTKPFSGLVKCQYYLTSESEYKDFFYLNEINDTSKVLRFFSLSQNKIKFILGTENESEPITTTVPPPTSTTPATTPDGDPGKPSESAMYANFIESPAVVFSAPVSNYFVHNVSTSTYEFGRTNNGTIKSQVYYIFL